VVSRSCVSLVSHGGGRNSGLFGVSP
jgi:hypothetical protein